MEGLDFVVVSVVVVVVASVVVVVGRGFKLGLKFLGGLLNLGLILEGCMIVLSIGRFGFLG